MASPPPVGGCWGGWGRIALGGVAGRRAEPYPYISNHDGIHRICPISTLRVRQKKTRCSPRTRMLTRILMVQMSKHMDMQSRRTLFCNSLFEQSCTYFSCYQSAVWSGKCRVWSVECKVRSVECKVWSG